MTDSSAAGTFKLGDRPVHRLGYGAMQLAGPGVFGPPKDRASALAVLREAVANGVDHIDTSDFYGPHVTNALIREALHPYPAELVIVTKIGARRGADASWNPAFGREELTAAVHDNLRNLGLDVLEIVNLRLMFGHPGPAEGSVEAPLAVLAELQRQGLVRHIGLSNATPRQVAEARGLADIVCVQNHYNLAHREDDALVATLAADGIAFVPYFRARRLLAPAIVDPVGRGAADRRHADAGGAGLAAAARAQHPADPRHVVAGPPAREPGGSVDRAAGRDARRTRRHQAGRPLAATRGRTAPRDTPPPCPSGWRRPADRGTRPDPGHSASSTATPGSVLPSSHSRKAPPADDT